MNTFLLADGDNKGPGWTTIPNQEESGADEVTSLHGVRGEGGREEWEEEKRGEEGGMNKMREEEREEDGWMDRTKGKKRIHFVNVIIQQSFNISLLTYK